MLVLLVYLPGFWWGAPHATGPERVNSWGVDDETPLGPLAEMHNILEPKPDRNLGYPLMYSFVVAGSYAPYLGYLKMTGGMDSPSGEYPFGLADPVSSLKMMSYIAHLVSVLMGVGVVLAAFETGRVLMNRCAGVLSALFAMTCYPMFYYARSGNVDVPVLCFMALTLMMFARCLSLGFTSRRAIWLGVFAGFALGTKEQALGAFLIIPFVLLATCWREHEGRWRSRKFWRVPFAGTLASIIAFGIGSGLFVEPSRYWAHVTFMWDRVAIIARGDIYVPYVFPPDWAGNVGYVQRVFELLRDMITLPGVILGLAGLIWLLVRRPKAMWVAVTAIAYFGFIFYMLRSPQMRYTMPVAYLLSFPAAWIVAAAWGRKEKILRWGMMALAVSIIGFNFLRGVGLTYEMVQDSRYEAAQWIADNTEAGDTVEYFGPSLKLPPLEASVTDRQTIDWIGIYRQPRVDDTAVQEILAGWEERRPRFIIIMPDLTSRPGVEHSTLCPPQLFQALLDGSHGHVLEEEFKTEPLFSWIALPELDYPTVNPKIRVFTLPNSPRP